MNSDAGSQRGESPIANLPSAMCTRVPLNTWIDLRLRYYSYLYFVCFLRVLLIHTYLVCALTVIFTIYTNRASNTGSERVQDNTAVTFPPETYSSSPQKAS